MGNGLDHASFCAFDELNVMCDWIMCCMYCVNCMLGE